MATEIIYDEEKFAELVLYVAAKCQDHQRFGATKLNKILFYADFWAYLDRGKPITGAEYQKLAHGPAPRRMMPVQDKLISSGAAARQDAVRVTDYVEKRLIALRRPRLDLFEAEEIAIVDEIIDKLESASATGVSRRSHKLPGWKLAEMNETIPYFTAHLPPDQAPLSGDDRAWAIAAGESFLSRAV